MRKTFIGAVIFLAGACAQTALPTAPTATPAAQQVPVEQPIVGWTPKHHNIPAAFADQPTGPIVYLCATQLRPYYTTNTGVVVMEEDHYLQYTPCPVEPIK